MEKPPNWFWAGVLLTAIFGTMATVNHFNAESRRADDESRRRAALEAYKVAEGAEREEQLSGCMGAVYEDYKSRWAKSCRALDEWSDCRLPAETARDYGRDLEASRNRCLERFGPGR
jgi:hypothetical protein